MTKITIIDAPMGSGKTVNAILQMHRYLDNQKKFIYVTPFLSEIKRVLKDLDSNLVQQPTERKGLPKRLHFIELINDGMNIVTTHQLFANLTKMDYEMLSDYVLILDEVISPAETLFIGKKDLGYIENDLIKINRDVFPNTIEVIDNEYTNKKYLDVVKLCSKSTETYIMKEQLIVWLFPEELFTKFDKVFILTYMFESSELRYYLDMKGIEFTLNKDYDADIEFRARASELLNIYEGRANKVGHKKYSFSLAWAERLSLKEAKRYGESVRKLFMRTYDAKPKYSAYTTFKKAAPRLSNNIFIYNDNTDGFTENELLRNGFISINSRATNEFGHKKHIAYLANRFMSPDTKFFFDIKGDSNKEDNWALSELIQFLWRGCIRNGEVMDVFIPSRRMRELLKNWLEEAVTIKLAA